MIRFTIPGPPTGKGRPRVTRSGHAYTPQKTRNAEAHVKLLAGQAMAGRPPIAGAVRVDITIGCTVPQSWPAKRKREAEANRVHPGKPDLDNVVKLIMDALNGVVVADDKQVAQIVARKRFSGIAETGVEVTELT